MNRFTLRVDVLGSSSSDTSKVWRDLVHRGARGAAFWISERTSVAHLILVEAFPRSFAMEARTSGSG